MKISTTKITIEKYSERVIFGSNDHCPQCGQEYVSPSRHQANATEVSVPQRQQRSETNIDRAIALIAEKINSREK